MSRARRQDPQNAVQLFPFVAVLLCTMGSLLVLLIVIARSSRAHALEEAVAAQAKARAAARAQAADVSKKSAAAQAELDQIKAYRSKLDSVRAKAADELHQEQLRLSHLEDHMRRLQDQLESLKVAAAELNTLEGQHFDDRKQALAEVDRLQQLIDESRRTIERLRAESQRAKSYAIVPYQGKRGTFRRPVYIECRGDEVILQPEGVVFTPDDFRPPIGPGNALVAALRAAREHIVEYESSGLQGQAAEPYPLIVVRPKGIVAYYCVREAIQSWDDEFGYELVEEDWDLKYAPPNPQLAAKESQAAELARNRLRALADAAPQAYGAYRAGSGFGNSNASGIDDDDDEDGPPFGGGSGGDTDAGPVGDARFAPRSGGRPLAVATTNDTLPPGTGGAERAPASDGGAGDNRYAVGNSLASNVPPGVTSAPSTNPSKPTGESSRDDSSGPSPTGSANATASGPQPRPGDIERKPDGSPANGAYGAGEDPEQEFDKMARAAAGDRDGDKPPEHQPTKARGKNWAIANGRPGMIPIRRSIQIVVRDDALVMLPEASSTNEASAAGQVFPFADAPEAAYDRLISAVEKRIKDWGIAGQGLYWRPVVELKVGANGDHRVDDLVRLLKYSGVDIRGSEIAQHEPGGSDHANR
jgi:hypothetical protein